MMSQGLNPNRYFLKYTIAISLLCHILIFSSVELTFGKKLTDQDFSSQGISFLGSILSAESLNRPSAVRQSNSPAGLNESTSQARLITDLLFNSILEKDNLRYEGLNPVLFNLEKPALFDLFSNKSVYFKPAVGPDNKGASSTIMFHPPMPYHFLLYFKDRQTAHVEVAFYIPSDGKFLDLKRRVSSGNPEVDLLIMRNLSRFINLCKSNFTLDNWQTVNIDLSP